MREDISNFKLIKLPPNGPKPGQSTRSWVYGKDQHSQREIDRIRWKEKNKRGGRK